MPKTYECVSPWMSGPIREVKVPKRWQDLEPGDIIKGLGRSDAEEASAAGLMWKIEKDNTFSVKRPVKSDEERVLSIIINNGGEITLGVLTNRLRTISYERVKKAIKNIEDKGIVITSENKHKYNGNIIYTFTMVKDVKNKKPPEI